MADFGQLTMDRGDDRTIVLEATWPEDVPELGKTEGDPYDLSGKEAVVEAWADLQDPGPSFAKNELGGALTVNGNEARVKIEPEDSSGFTESTTLKLRVRVTENGQRWTVGRGELRFEL